MEKGRGRGDGEPGFTKVWRGGLVQDPALEALKEG